MPDPTRAVFYRTLGIFREVTGKDIKLLFKDVRTASASDKHITLPDSKEGSIFDVDHPRPLYTAFEHELAHILFKSDARLRDKFIKEFSEFPELAFAIYNILEDHRVESLWGRIYHGSRIFMKSLAEKVYKRDIEDRANNPIIRAMLAGRAGHPELMPIELPNDIREGIVRAFKDVENAGPATVYLVARRLMNLIRQYLMRQMNISTQGQAQKSRQRGMGKPIKAPSKQHGEGGGQKGQGVGKGEGGESGKGHEQRKGETRESLSESDKGSTEGTEKGEEKEQAREAEHKGKKGGGGSEASEVSKEVESAVNKLMKKLSKEVEWRIAPFDEENTKSLSKEEMREIRRKLKEIEKGKLDEQSFIEKDKKEIAKYVEEIERKIINIQFKKPEQGIVGEVIKEDVFNSSYIKSKPDMKLVNALKRFFARLRGKAMFVSDEEGIDIDIDNYVQRVVGRTNVPPFMIEEEKPGLNIVLLLDCSNSMSHWGKIFKAREIALTLYDALKSLKSVNMEVYAFAGSRRSSYETPVVKLTRDRLTNISPSSHRYPMTHTWRAVQYVTNILRLKPGKRLLIILTDGLPQASSTYVNVSFDAVAAWTAYAIRKARRNGIKVYTIMVSPSIDKETMTRIYGPETTWSVVGKMKEAGKILLNVVTKEIYRMMME